MRRILLALVLSGLTASVHAGPDAQLGPRDVSLRWDRLDCFGYAPKSQGYACLDFSVGADAGDPGLTDFEAWTPPPDTAWRGHKAVMLVGDRTQELAIASKNYDHTRVIARSRSARAAVRLALKRGYRHRVTRRTTLRRGTWTRFHGVALRFDTRMHEGSASYQNHGSLRIRCGAREVVIVEDNQAEAAVAFAAPGAPTIAVGFVEVDGGEGAEYYNTAYIRIAVDQACQRTSGDERARSDVP